MPTLKRQKADGTWEFLQLVGQEYIDAFDNLKAGVTGQILNKVSDDDYDFEWIDFEADDEWGAL